jgi:hypothetical protein
MTRSSRGDGLPMGYRVLYRLRMAALTVLGPAELDERSDPKARLRREREARVARARAQGEHGR